LLFFVQVHPSSFRFGGRPLLDMLASFRTHASVPVFVHIDHSGPEVGVCCTTCASS